ncbi:MAG: cytochrome c maturation protein CcmE [Gammaproteobacteria bacterium]|nr:cytochrome c maturation protein CcmE [Gammaproteobacteria bacterium]MXY06186.1 cytochrome c maturation protein CcmE [Gammaproteobacteria bacterium]MYG13074.1 cytochrome c maturation protein CcmE [Gammaproteobacteria bacterium]MYH17462.1 cytochrome c maturation protein CcmE [Gammaproteobacteria bacterium]MYK82817.1 cytochrome c maturation protein CcmE [Gammaproteobacteria bacterium]
MHPKRRSRLMTVVFVLTGAAAAVALMLRAANENLNLFYPPDQVAGGEAPVGVGIRAGGMVLEGSVVRAADSLDVAFVLTDYQGADFRVAYSGILPDLFREGQGILVRGQLGADGVFQAEEVLAKHDENYMPPELMPLAEANEAMPQTDEWVVPGRKCDSLDDLAPRSRKAAVADDC